MKKVLTVLTLLIGFQANAGLITIATNQDSVNVGDSVTVSLTGSDFDVFDMFNFDFLFDTTIYDFAESSLSSDLPLLDEFFDAEGLRATSFADSGVFFDFYQWDEVFTDGDEFVLASFDLTAIGSGDNTFSFAESYFSSDVTGNFFVDTSAQLNSQVQSVSVPEPTTFAIFTLGLMGLAIRRFKLGA